MPSTVKEPELSVTGTATVEASTLRLVAVGWTTVREPLELRVTVPLTELTATVPSTVSEPALSSTWTTLVIVETVLTVDRAPVPLLASSTLMAAAAVPEPRAELKVTAAAGATATVQVPDWVTPMEPAEFRVTEPMEVEASESARLPGARTRARFGYGRPVMDASV